MLSSPYTSSLVAFVAFPARLSGCDLALGDWVVLITAAIFISLACHALEGANYKKTSKIFHMLAVCASMYTLKHWPMGHTTKANRKWSPWGFTKPVARTFESFAKAPSAQMCVYMMVILIVVIIFLVREWQVSAT